MVKRPEILTTHFNIGQTGVTVFADPAMERGKPYSASPSAIVMHPDDLRHLAIELGPGTYATKCAGHERVRYDRRLAAVRAGVMYWDERMGSFRGARR